MGIFTSIGSLFSPRIRKVRASQRTLERSRAQNMVNDAERAIAFRGQEDPREQAQLNQSMFARGLGKSTIADQDKARLSMIQGQRMSKMIEARDYAYAYKKYIKRKHEMEKVNKYMQVLDSILSVAGGAGGGPSGDTGYGGGADTSFSWGGGEGGDFNFGGGSGNA